MHGLTFLLLLLLPLNADAKRSSEPEPPAIGREAPWFSVRDTEGNIIDSRQLKGKIIVLEWTNHECPYVQRHYRTGAMQSLQRELASSNDLRWYTIHSSAPGRQGHVLPAKAEALRVQHNARPTAIIVDENGTLGRLYKAATTPQLFVIGRDGAIAYMGAIDDAPSTDTADIPRRNYVRDVVAALRADRPVQVPSVPPYGCDIKY